MKKNLTEKIIPFVALACLLFLSSCSFTRQVSHHNFSALEFAQNINEIPYAHSEKNALCEENISEEVAENELFMADANEAKALAVQPGKNKNVIAKKIKKSIKIAGNSGIKKIKNAIPAPQQFNQSAAKKWNPGRSNFSMTWKDVLFVFVLMVLLLLLGGLLHNMLSLSLPVTLAITIVTGFVVLCIYIWYLSNK